MTNKKMIKVYVDCNGNPQMELYCKIILRFYVRNQCYLLLII